jgi:3',5'-cyclic AMP phosphodiesterase CpdA
MRKAALLVTISCLFILALLLSSCGGAATTPDNGVTVNGGTDENLQANNDFSFLVCGDPDGRTDLLEQIIGQMRQGEFLVIVGDLTKGGDLEGMERVHAFLEPQGIDYYVIPGDNDMPTGDPSTFQAVFGPDYYSLDVQDSHLVFLDNAIFGVGLPEEELSWLREDLASTDKEVIIAFAHVPPGAPIKLLENEAAQQEDESNLETLEMLEQAGAEVIYCGHLHGYLLYSSGPPRVVISGGAGAHLHLSEEAGGYHNFLRVTVEGDTVSEEVIPL